MTDLKLADIGLKAMERAQRRDMKERAQQHARNQPMRVEDYIGFTMASMVVIGTIIGQLYTMVN